MYRTAKVTVVDPLRPGCKAVVMAPSSWRVNELKEAIRDARPDHPLVELQRVVYRSLLPDDITLGDAWGAV